MGLLEVAARIEQYDPKASPDNRADELDLHRDIVLATGIGGMNPSFETTFVRSLDAAMTLVPEGRTFSLHVGVERFDANDNDIDGPWSVASIYLEGSKRWAGDDVFGRSPALALCAAALRALAATQERTGHG